MSKMYERIRELAGSMSDTELCKQSGVSRSTLSELKFGRTEQLSVKNLNKLANFFNVSVDELADQQKEKPTSISASGVNEELRERMLVIQKVLATKPENEWRACLDAFEKLAR